MADMEHFSYIRIGNRVIYNGVNGDAFSFGEKPVPLSNSNPSEIDGSASSSLNADNIVKEPSSNTPAKSSNQTTQIATFDTSQVAKTPEYGARRTDNTHRLSLGYAPKTPLTNLSKMAKDDLQLSLRLTPDINSFWNSASPLQHLTPAAVGLPPILPPPPAAHLPPPLPSRPPSAVPSPASSMSSLLSFKQEDRSLMTPPLSPTKTAETPSANEENPSPHLIRSFFFRSSGTIKVEAPSRDLQHSAPHAPLSPPPLPLPTSHPLSSSPLLGVKTISPSSDCNKPAVTATTPEPIQVSPSSISSHTTTASISSHTTTPSISSHTTTASTSSHNDSEEEEDCQLPSYPDSSLDAALGGQLVPARNGDIFSQKTRRPSQQNNDVNRKIIPPEFESIRKQSLTYADVISNMLMFYKLRKGKKKKIPYVQPKLEKASHCRKCGRLFGLRCFRHHCSRCKKSFCDTCIPITRVDTNEQENQTSSLTRVCELCGEEIAFETSRGAYRGLWSEFKQMRDEARAHRGLDVTSSTIHKPLESQSMLDATPGLMSLCLRFLGDVHQEADKQPRHNFLVNYLHFENTSQNRLKGKIIKNKECQACNRQLRMLTDIRDCNICEQTFCMNCTYPTLQMYLPPGTDLKGNIRIERVRFHVKATEQDEVESTEVSEIYRVCADCEDDIARNLRIHKFSQKIPEIESEMFDIQRQIDHALTYGPHLHGLQRSVSANNIYYMNEHEAMAINIKMANQLYNRYMRAYDNLERMAPQTSGQKALHKHIKQAMYEFYLKRRDQLNSTLRYHDSWTNASNEVP